MRWKCACVGALSCVVDTRSKGAGQSHTRAIQVGVLEPELSTRNILFERNLRSSCRRQHKPPQYSERVEQRFGVAESFPFKSSLSSDYAIWKGEGDPWLERHLYGLHPRTASLSRHLSKRQKRQAIHQRLSEISFIRLTPTHSCWPLPKSAGIWSRYLGFPVKSGYLMKRTSILDCGNLCAGGLLRIPEV